MKKLVKILAALTVAVAALAFIGCQDGFAGPDGTVVTNGGGSGSGSGGSSGGEATLPAPVGTYNLTSATTSQGSLTSGGEGWDDFIASFDEDETTIVISNDGITIMGTDFTWDEWEAVEDDYDYTVEGTTITVENAMGTLVFTKA